MFSPRITAFDPGIESRKEKRDAGIGTTNFEKTLPNNEI
jgi:hypothetical protein